MSAAYRKLVRAGQNDMRAKALRAAGEQGERAPMLPEQEIYGLANPLALFAFWNSVRAHGEMLMWQRRASVLRAWCALRIARQRNNSIWWRKICREELAAAAGYHRDEQLARGLGRRAR